MDLWEWKGGGAAWARGREAHCVARGIVSIGVSHFPCRVIDMCTAFGGPGGDVSASSLPVSVPLSLSMLCFLPSAGASTACPGPDSDGEGATIVVLGAVGKDGGVEWRILNCTGQQYKPPGL